MHTYCTIQKLHPNINLKYKILSCLNFPPYSNEYMQIEIIQLISVYTVLELYTKIYKHYMLL